MVKHYQNQLLKEPIINSQKLLERAAHLQQLRRKDFIHDCQRASIKKKQQYTKRPFSIQQFPIVTNSECLSETIENENQQVIREIRNYKMALNSVNTVLKKLKDSLTKSERPADYLVEMYKSDKQMFKVRRYITQKEEKIKEKMQGKQYMSKAKKKERAKKKAEAKRQKKKAKMAQRRSKKPKNHLNGKRKIKK